MQTASILRRDVPWIAAKCEFNSNLLPGRARRWSFLLTALGLCSVSSCWSHGASETYTLFIDDAQIADVNHDGQPWCMGGALPAASVAATLAPTVRTTTERVTLTPSWREPVADGEVFSYRKGLSLDVRGRCDGPSFFMGRALLHPDTAMLQSRGVALGPIGNVTRLRLHFERARPGVDGGTDPSFGYGDGDYGWYDPDPAAGDPGYDWGDAPDDPGDEASGDDGSGDTGGDCCSDGDGEGDSGGDWRRLRQHGGVAAKRTTPQKR